MTIPVKRFVSIGECMGELAPAGDGNLHLGFAGDTFNTAWYARQLLPESWQVDYLTALGDDPMSADMLRFMETEGIGTSAIRIIKGKSPGLYLITLKNGERSFTYWRSDSAARQLAADRDHLSHSLAGASCIYLSGITLAILPPADAATLLDEIAKARTFVAFDPNYRTRLWQGRSDHAQLIARAAAIASLVLPSFDDEALAFGDKTPEQTLSRYLAAGARNVIVKNGAKGATVQVDGESFQLDAKPVSQVIDTTGAGDSFNAGFLTRYLMDQDVKKAAGEAAALAARVVTAHGALVAFD